MRVLNYQLPIRAADTFVYLGLAVAISQVLRLVRFITLHARLSNIKIYRRSSSWALITGASDGIGLGFAQELAIHGFNLVLHGRNPSKLERVKADLLASQPASLPISIRIVTADASNSHGMKAAVEALVASLDDLPGPLTVLVNNVGGSVPMASAYTPLSKYSSADVDGLINLNARFTTQLTRTLLPTLQYNKPSLIINVGSVTGIGGTMGGPYLSVYSATKAYDLALSAALTREMEAEHSGVEILGLVVGEVTEASHSTSSPSFFSPGRRTFAKAALGKVGCGKSIVTPYWGHALQCAFFELLPARWQNGFILSELRKRKAAELKRT